MAGSASRDYASDLFCPKRVFLCCFFILFSTATRLSLTACLVFCDRGHVQPLGLSMSRKEVTVASARELNLGARTDVHTHTQPTAVSEEDSFARSFCFTSPYILLWPRKLEFLSCSFGTPLPSRSLLGITLYSLK